MALIAERWGHDPRAADVRKGRQANLGDLCGASSFLADKASGPSIKHACTWSSQQCDAL